MSDPVENVPPANEPPKSPASDSSRASSSIEIKLSRNELILRNILSHCDGPTVRECQFVSYQWYYMSQNEIRFRRKFINFIAPFYFDRAVMDPAFREMRNASPTVKREYNSIMEGELHDPLHYINEFTTVWKRSLTKPCQIILTAPFRHFNLSENVRWSRSDILDALRSRLPPDCTLTGIDAHHGILGRAHDSIKDELTCSYPVNGILAMTGLIIPKIDGVTVKTLIPREDGPGLHPVASNVKALIILPSPGSTCHGYTPSAWANEVIETYRGRIAIGGAQIDEAASPTAPEGGHFYFANDGYSTNIEPVSPTVIQFSGHRCRAASFIYKELYDRPILQHRDKMLSYECFMLKEKLEQFRSNLTFPYDSNACYQTIGFLFLNLASYRDYRKFLSTIHRISNLVFYVFPKIMLKGFICKSTMYGHNYIPEKDSPILPEGNQTKLVVNNGILSLVLINVKRNGFRPDPFAQDPE